MNRLSVINAHLRPPGANTADNSEGQEKRRKTVAASSKDILIVVDERTGNEYSLSIQNDTVQAKDFGKIRVPGGPSLRIYDPGQMNTCVCSSRITYIDGAKGILRYRGYPIETLAEKVCFEECAFLLMYGELPSASQLASYTATLRRLADIPTDLRRLIKTFRPDAHPMGMLMSCLAAAGTLFPEANPCIAGQTVYKDVLVRNKHLLKVLAMMPAIAANIQRHRQGLQLVNPDPKLGFTASFMAMMDRRGDSACYSHPVLVKALDILFILHADHELNCSTAAARHVASSNADIYTSMAAATGALYGPRHGGANEAVVRMLERIKTIGAVPEFIAMVKDRKEKLMGFGHRVYKSYDPRANIIRQVAELVFKVVGDSPLIEVARELERVAMKDPYFTTRRLYPNVDFYSGIIYKAMGFPIDFFPLLFAIPRTAGWTAHFNEFINDPENRIARPFQVYLGHGLRSEVPPIEERQELVTDSAFQVKISAEERRQLLSVARDTSPPPNALTANEI
ncbi:putative citrate synthase [Toxoplasma gondii RUB]|uniref:Citrate synthase n=11 Tax=Toxoplasma gondii TaxID=5811 RepID=A0A125YTX3_TOXGV|nr:putative citrate synthase [Toxoplasma gondii GT1]ESS32921.1 putative citrate synthase [Toxoplasma gondii VEG]KAF4642862.1 putative citrate synthase [Toxoplasma gondii]KFG37731.1 putative citrate synthase [Toxoplasma gondii GAB2-2007-GAL-DOM2]KFG46004.1 putative citrate synthase [Toxoplasma gondii p89]KFG53702.1 putative citrate synthase [Toxoplasma gondii FOU]KFG61923.1 putative citrate synthase [Toxoplasma gondii RUB]KFH07103.1 putative citrate synthase [Toxoplasma gondii VAND]KFH09223.